MTETRVELPEGCLAMIKCRLCGRLHYDPAPQFICICGEANWNLEVDGLKRCLSIDFDATIHAYSRGWQDGNIYDPPMEGAIEAMFELQHRGYHLIILTAREPKWHEQVSLWLQEHWFEALEVSDSCRSVGRCARGLHKPPQVSNQKTGAIAYIDDRAFKFEHWKGVLDEFQGPQAK